MTNTHRPTPRCRRISWDYDKRYRAHRDPNARWTCTCGASGNVHETDPTKTPTKEKR